MAEQDTKTEPYLNLWFGILMAATAVGYGIWTFVVGSSDSYYNFMLIGATLLLVGLWILVSVRIVYLLRRSKNKGKRLGKKKGIRFLTIVIFVGAGSDIHTQWEAMKTGKQQESQDETYHNGTEISTEADIKNQETDICAFRKTNSNLHLSLKACTSFSCFFHPPIVLFVLRFHLQVLKIL